MLKRFLFLIAAVSLLAACETASKNSGTTGGAGGTGGTGNSSDVSASDNSSSASGSGGSTVDSPMSDAEELISLGDTVYFDYDSSALSAESKSTLSAQAAFLAANPALTIMVEGHCDERGTREYNLALGDRRAIAARDYLVAQGVDAARIKTISYGKERPAFVGSNDLAYSKNRRSVSIIR